MIDENVISILRDIKRLERRLSKVERIESYPSTSAVIRGDTSLYRRYYHMPLFSANPGASGATWTAPSANTTGGYQLNAASEVLYMEADIHADWDGKSNPVVEIHFQVNVDNSGGSASDTVDLKLVCYYMGEGEFSCKTQTVEVATVVGASVRYKQFEADFPVDWDAVLNNVEVGDVIGFVLNLETDTSEVDDIIVVNASFYYQTAHVGIESGDV